MNKEKLDKIIKESPLLPILTATFILVATFAGNAHALEWKQIWIPLGLCIIPGIVIWLVLWLIKDLRFISATASSVCVIIILFYDLIPEIYHRGLAPVLIVFFGVGLVALLSKYINKALKPITVILVVCIVCSLGLAQFKMIKGTGTVESQNIVQAATINDELPNIYFIIPDRFTSHEALLECGYDNSKFIEEMRSLGFYVRDNSLSSDPFTMEDDVTSTRTLRYLASVFSDGEEIPLDIDYNVAGEKVRFSSTVQQYQTMGYEYYNIGSWYAETAISRLTENNYIYQASSVLQAIYSDVFTCAIIDRSVGRYLYISPLLPSKAYAQTERDRQAYQLETLRNIIDIDSDNKLVFMHLLLPHPPFIWTADGQPQENTELDIIELYVEQVKYTETLLIGTTEYILENDSDAIIIIQSDEGMCFTGENTDVNYQLSNTQFNGTLTAWKLPVDNNKLENISSTEILKYVRENCVRTNVTK